MSYLLKKNLVKQNNFLVSVKPKIVKKIEGFCSFFVLTFFDTMGSSFYSSFFIQPKVWT